MYPTCTTFQYAHITDAQAQQLSPVQAAVVRDTSKSYTRATALPKDLVQRIAKLETDAYVVRNYLAPHVLLHATYSWSLHYDVVSTTKLNPMGPLTRTIHLHRRGWRRARSRTLQSLPPSCSSGWTCAARR